MRILVVSASVPFEQRDEELVAEHLSRELEKTGNTSDLIRLPFDGYHRDLPGQMLAFNLLDLVSWADCVITIGVPGWAVEHPNKRVWFFSHHRPLYELWNTQWGLLFSPHNALMRRALIEADRTCLTKAKKVFAASLTGSRQILDYHRINSEVLFPPVLDESEASRENYGDYIYSDSYFSEEMRHDLMIRAIQKTQSDVHLVLATGPGRVEYWEYLNQLVNALGLSDRVTLLGAELNSAKRLELVAHARACVYIPYSANWWGLFVLRAYRCRRAVVTCTDSDGVKELVQPGQGGLTVTPDPEALGEAFDRLYAEEKMARQLGEEAYLAASELIPSWGQVIERLLG